jgi:hypothetical protein
MRYFALATLLALTACQSSAVPQTPGVPAARGSQPRERATRASLPPGTYLAMVRPDKGAIQYYSLSGSTARLAGEAYVKTGNCTIWWQSNISVDRQGGIDFPIDCPSGIGFMQASVGRLGTVTPRRTILTHFPVSSTYLQGAIDSLGNIAIAVDPLTQDGQLERIDHKVLVFDSRASGFAPAKYSLALRTQGCNLPLPVIAKGPRKLWAGAEQIAYSSDDSLMVAAGPIVTCGPMYVERFLPGAQSYSNWFMPILLPHNAAHQPAFSTTGDFIAGPQGELIFGAYFEHPKKHKFEHGLNGAVEYAAGAAGFAPLPRRTFADSEPDFGGDEFRQAEVIGIDAAGNTYVKLAQGKAVNGTVRPFNVIAVFGPKASGATKPTRAVLLRGDLMSFGSAIFDVRL